MSHFLSVLPLWELILLVVIVPTAVAVGLQIVVRKWVGFERLELNNEVAGFMFAAIGVVYAVLLAFVVIAVWEKFSEGQTSVARESAAASALFHYAEGAEPEAARLHDRVVDYLKLTIEKDWPAMAAETEDRETSHALDALYRAAMALNRTGTRSTADMSEVFTQVDNLTLARRVRVHLSTGLVPDVIWIALFAGAGLTIYFALFFGNRDGIAQLAMTAILSIVLTSGLVVIISLDHPFSGPVHIAPESLEHVLAAETEG
ncbi:bestrophin-like domain [Roseiarcus sp.]|uniref:bestrophin-like domain n=1 Tax=Roseiarcus sp. TaxID=1969460 RepID=UPI003F9B27C6